MRTTDEMKLENWMMLKGFRTYYIVHTPHIITTMCKSIINIVVCNVYKNFPINRNTNHFN